MYTVRKEDKKQNQRIFRLLKVNQRQISHVLHNFTLKWYSSQTKGNSNNNIIKYVSTGNYCASSSSLS